MLKIIVIILLLLGAQCSATVFAPAKPGKAWILWPFATDSKSVLGFTGGIPQNSNIPYALILVLLGGVSVLGFLAAIASLLGFLVPAAWWMVLVLTAAVLSIVLHILFIGPLAILPILVDLALLYGVFFQHWTVATIH